MKNMLTIKRLLAVLLIVTMVEANSTMSTNASMMKFDYLSLNDRGESTFVSDNIPGNTLLKNAVCKEDRDGDFALDGKLANR